METFLIGFLGDGIKTLSVFWRSKSNILWGQIVGLVLMCLFWHLNGHVDVAIITALAFLSTLQLKTSLAMYYYFWLIPYGLVYLSFTTHWPEILLGILPLFARGGGSTSIMKSRFILTFLYFIAFSLIYQYYSITIWAFVSLALTLISFKRDRLAFEIFRRYRCER